VSRSRVVYRPADPAAGGWFEVNPALAARLASLGLDSAAGFLDLAGEVVSGHPDRHVVRVELPGFASAFYLKRQHAVTRRERLRNRVAGFGWSSRSAREALLLRQLAAAGLPCPRWAAFGEDARGRAFLLVEEVADAADLRRVLSDTGMSLDARRDLATRLGRLVAVVHATSFTTPDLTAKHLLVSHETGDITPIDWQSSRRVRTVPTTERLRALAMLHASVADELASPRERLRVLRAALGPAREAGAVAGRFSELARRVAAEAERLRDRRSIRDQRQPAASPLRLVWVAGEAVCATPEVAATWPKDAVAEPFYGGVPGEFRVAMPDGREAHLIRGREFAPLARLAAALRGKAWRSPGVTLGRLLFHLERYGVAAPRLLAFGQRLTGVASAEWFALHTPQPDALHEIIDPAAAEQLGRLLRRLHDAGCRVVGEPQAAFGGTTQGASVRDLTRVALATRLTARDREADLARLVAPLPPEARAAAEAGYCAGPAAPAPRRTIPTAAEVSA
jgi:tRNA A-37 threonylcarbamoyl transferase component Bud32